MPIDQPLVYRLLAVEDIPAVSGLVDRVFDRFVAPDYAPEGVREFHRYSQAQAFEVRARVDHFSLVALSQGGPVGMIEVRGYQHISLLFVEADFQRRGVARELLYRALEMCRAHTPDLAEISVNSSPYAVSFYEKLGFSQSGERQVRNGIDFIPMTWKLPASPIGSVLKDGA